MASQPIDFLNIANAAYLDEMYDRWRADPHSVDEPWALFFAGFEAGIQRPCGEDGEESAPVRGVYALVNAYREYGHLIADLDPLGRQRKKHPFLEASQFGCTPDDMSKPCGSGGFKGGFPENLGDLVDRLEATYCGTIALECMEIPNEGMRNWLIEQVEPTEGKPRLEPAHRKRTLFQILEAEVFEQFLQTKYLGKKRFSVEGGEALLPILHNLVEHGAAQGIDEMILGMAHRGRLNVLTHILDKPYEDMLGEFEGSFDQTGGLGAGDVKYHMGYSTDVVTPTGKRVHLSLSPNPSHLELVDPVIEGVVRAKQEYLQDQDRSRVVPIMIHGDAAFTGQGIVPETLALSELEDYSTGGTIHVIVNNQVGFTANPEETRFTVHPSDVGKMIATPILHVNADDPEAAVWAAKLAIAFRQRFKVDVIIHLMCYRRYGHNEGDDPTFTQPTLYAQIEDHPTVCELYSERLVSEGTLSADDVAQMRDRIRRRLDEALEHAKKQDQGAAMTSFGGIWAGFTRAGSDWSAPTQVPLEILQRVGRTMLEIPEGFHVHGKLERRLWKDRAKMVEGDAPVDWGCGEHLAYATLLAEGFPVRLAGQDARRGTFSHRHAALRDVKTDDVHIPLQHLSEEQGSFTVINTMLSELAVLGFEYGMTWADPRRLVVWEAQFGDFANGAQAIIDQFITSAESKWQRYSGLVMLLPHGYEGQGPEHSSARLERYLQSCAEDNIQVVNLTNPAQIFHALRRQIHRRFRKPLVVMSPKLLLRHPEAVSPLEDFTDRAFQTVLDDPEIEEPAAVRRVAFCSGKVYYTLKKARKERGAQGTALVRLEQIYPFPEQRVKEVLRRYSEAKEVFWVQEEPRNMGAWTFVDPLLREVMGGGRSVFYCGRPAAASPATGNHLAHQEEENAFLEQFFGSAESAAMAG